MDIKNLDLKKVLKGKKACLVRTGVCGLAAGVVMYYCGIPKGCHQDTLETNPKTVKNPVESFIDDDKDLKDFDDVLADIEKEIKKDSDLLLKDRLKDKSKDKSKYKSKDKSKDSKGEGKKNKDSAPILADNSDNFSGVNQDNINWQPTDSKDTENDNSDILDKGNNNLDTSDKNNNNSSNDNKKPVKPDKPGVKPDKPGVKPDKPGVKPDKPGVKPDKPGVKPDEPSVKPDEPQHKHNISTITELVDNKNGTHTTITKEVCSAGDYSAVVSQNTENCQYSDWHSIGAEGEEKTCGVCSHGEYRGHSMGAAITGSYQYNGDGTHSATTTQECTTCDYEISTVDTQSCDMTGTPKDATDGVSVQVECPTCLNNVVVHTHNLETYYEKDTVSCCKAVTECKDTDCPTSYHVETAVPHAFEDTDIVNSWDNLLKQVCSNCGEENWIPYTPTTTSDAGQDSNSDLDNNLSDEEWAELIVNQYEVQPEPVDAKLFEDTDYLDSSMFFAEDAYENTTEEYVKELVLN